MSAEIAIVVAGFNRPMPLMRLLHSIQKANYEGYSNITLIISLDFSGNNECIKVAESFQWRVGEKKIIAHTSNLGLKAHIISCGDLTEDFDAVIMLEDDLMVSPWFYDYAQQAFSFYKGKNVAGVSLYNPLFNETAYLSFEPVDDGHDNYFMQVPCSWGQLWSKQQWNAFKDYYNETISGAGNVQLPPNAVVWPDGTSWKKVFFRYMIHTNKYFVYPRKSLTTNFGDKGEHFLSSTQVFQSSLQMGKRNYNFSDISGSMSVYDPYCELEGDVYNRYCGNTFTVSFDLNGTKPLSSIRSEYLISSKVCSNPEKHFSATLYPYENNILLDNARQEMEDHFYSMGKTSSFSEVLNFRREAADVLRVAPQGPLRSFIISESIKQGRNAGEFYHKLKRFVKRTINAKSA